MGDTEHSASASSEYALSESSFAVSLADSRAVTELVSEYALSESSFADSAAPTEILPRTTRYGVLRCALVRRAASLIRSLRPVRPA